MEINLKILFILGLFFIGTSFILFTHHYYKSAVLSLILSLGSISYPLPTKFITANGETITLAASVRDTFLVESEPISTNWEKSETKKVSCGWFGHTEETTVTKNVVMRFKHQDLDGITLYNDRLENQTVVSRTRQPCPSF